MWVKDLFFFHEHPRVINYIEFSIILSPYLGPLITSFIVSGTTWSLITVTKLPVLTILVYYFLNFAWVIGVNTTVAIWLTDIYGFSIRDLGKLTWCFPIRPGSSCSATQAKTHQVTSTSSALSESCLDG